MASFFEHLLHRQAATPAPPPAPVPQAVAPTTTPTPAPAKAEESNPMSFISALESDLGKVEATLKSWWGKEPDIAKVVSAGVTTAGIALETVFTLEGNGAAATLVGNVVGKAQSDILAVNSTVAAIGPTVSAGSVLSGVAANLSTLEQAANITNPKSVTAVNYAVSTLNTLAASFPQPAPTPAAPPATPPPAAG